MAVDDDELPSSSAGLNEAHPARLACGQDTALVWDAAAGGRLSTHAQSCSYCQAVRADQAGLARAARELAAERLEPPPGLLDRVMGVIRAELRRDYLPLPARYGPAQVEHGAAVAVLRHTVDQMAGVRSRSCRIYLVTEPGDEQPALPNGNRPQVLDGVAGPPSGAVVRLSIAVAFGADLHSVAARTQQMVTAAAGQLLGLPVGSVDVEVVDVFDPAESSSNASGAP